MAEEREQDQPNPIDLWEPTHPEVRAYYTEARLLGHDARTAKRLTVTAAARVLFDGITGISTRVGLTDPCTKGVEWVRVSTWAISTRVGLTDPCTLPVLIVNWAPPYRTMPRGARDKFWQREYVLSLDTHDFDWDAMECDAARLRGGKTRAPRSKSTESIKSAGVTKEGEDA